MKKKQLNSNKAFLLVIDIGNTNIVAGIKQNDNWIQIWRFKTDKSASEFEYSMKLNNALWEQGIDVNQIDYKILSTVVPELKDNFIQILQKLNSKSLIVLDKEVFPFLNIDIPAPEEIGSDLVANVLAAYNIYKDNLIIIDFGTALTFTIVNNKGKILGVNIAPGLKTALNSLGDKTSQLDNVPLELPDSPLGTDTKTAIQNGVLLGYTGLISYMIERIKQEVGKDYKVLVTGGLHRVLKHELPQIDYIEPDLTLNGLAILPRFLDQ